MFSNSSGKDSSLLDLFSSAVQARKAPATAATTTTSTNYPSSLPNSPSASNVDLLRNLLMPDRGASPSGSSVTEVKTRKESSASNFDSSATANEAQVLVQFKKAAPNQPLMTASASILVYGASERRLRVVDWMRGWKCAIDRTQGAFVDVAFSTDNGVVGEDAATLAVLAEDGEVILGRVGTDEDAGELSFEAQAILSFPEIGRAAGLSWSSSDHNSTSIMGKKHLAVYGHNSSEVFFVHVQGSGPIISTKTSFISTRVEAIQNVTCIGNLCFVAGVSGVEVFKWSGASSSFEAAEFVQFAGDSEVRSFVFECPEQGIVIGRIEDGRVVKFFSYREGDAQEVSQITLPKHVSSVDSVVFDASTRVLLCYSRGGNNIHAFRIRKLKSPELITSAFTANAGILKFSLTEAFQDEEETEDEERIGFFAYLSDCIIQHSLNLEGSAKTIEIETDIETEVEADESLSEHDTDVSSPKITSIVTDSPSVTSSSSPSTAAIHPEEIKSLVRETVMECIQESLATIIHDALNASVQAGFDQISRDLSVLIEDLIRNVATVSAAGSLNLTVPAQLPTSPSIQDIRNLISEGKAGEALIKAASVKKDPRLLLEACRQLDDPFAALDKDPLSQATLVSLFKVLSADIDEDTELKLDWLQEVLIQIDLEQAIGESPTLLKDIGTLLGDLKELVGDSLVDGNLQKKMKTVMRLLRKFQMN